jgi:exonuclease III
VLTLLTINIQAAALPRAQSLTRWLDDRPEDVFLLTETSCGGGTAHLLDACRQAGMAVIHTPDPAGDRGVALVGRVPLAPRPDLFTGVTIPGRVAAATVEGTDGLTVAAVYVPSSDRAPDKVARKSGFIGSLLTALDQMPAQVRSRLVLGGDYNVITRDHQPPYRNFLPFEYAMLDALESHGLVDAHAHCQPDVQAHSWIGRGGNGYRFDYFHVGSAFTDRITSCSYLHGPREQKLTDHAAVALALEIPARERLSIDPAGLAGTGVLF